LEGDASTGGRSLSSRITEDGIVPNDGSMKAWGIAVAAVDTSIALLLKTLPVIAMPSDEISLLLLLSVPRLKRAQTPRKTMLAPRRLARELVLRVDVVESPWSCASVSDSPIR